MQQEAVKENEAPKEATDTTVPMTTEERARLVESCVKELAAAIPLAAAAEAALGKLRKRDFPEVGRSLRMPPRGVASVFECVIHLRTGLDESIELNPKTGRAKDVSWKQFERMCFRVMDFMYGLKSFKSEIDTGKVPQANVDMAKGVMKAMGDDFSADVVRKNANGSEWAALAAALVDWMRGMVSYYDVVLAVEEKKNSAQSAASLSLFQALENQAVAETIKLIEGAPGAVKERDAYGRLPIHVAIENHAPTEKMRRLAAELHAAIHEKNSAKVRALFAVGGVDISMVDESIGGSGIQCLHRAAFAGDAEVMAALLAEIKDCWLDEVRRQLLDCRTSLDYTPLMIASECGHVEVARMLEEKGCSSEVLGSAKARKTAKMLADEFKREVHGYTHVSAHLSTHGQKHAHTHALLRLC